MVARGQCFFTCCRIGCFTSTVSFPGGSKPKDLLTRVAQLEMQMLAVEGRSYEYIHSKVMIKNNMNLLLNKIYTGW
jgi:hypothetical protein